MRSAVFDHYAAQTLPADGSIAEHRLLVRRMALHFATRLPPEVELDDLIQAGLIGLFEASRNYDASQGAAFSSYAAIRIRGAMLDEMRRNDWVPRSVHRKARTAAAVICRIEQVTGRPATTVAIAKALGLSLGDYNRLVEEMNRGQVVSIDAERGDHTALDLIAHHCPSPLQLMEQRQFHRELWRQIQRLPGREKTVLTLYYEEELTLREIGQRLGITESRTCQIHGQAIGRLRRHLHALTVASSGTTAD